MTPVIIFLVVIQVQLFIVMKALSYLKQKMLEAIGALRDQVSQQIDGLKTVDQEIAAQSQKLQAEILKGISALSVQKVIPLIRKSHEEKKKSKEKGDEEETPDTASPYMNY